MRGLSFSRRFFKVFDISPIKRRNSTLEFIPLRKFTSVSNLKYRSPCFLSSSGYFFRYSSSNHFKDVDKPFSVPVKWSSSWIGHGFRGEHFIEEDPSDVKSGRGPFGEVEVNGRGMVMTFAVAGLVLIYWIKSQWSSVDAAKPIYNGDNSGENAVANDDDRGAKKSGGKRSNRERYNFISEVVEKVKDTVVSIELKDHSHVDFFTGVPRTASNGSGFIIGENGLILTNAHVVGVRPRTSFSVRLADGRTFAAKIEDIDYNSDLATIRIHAKNLPTLSLGDSSDSRIGEWVVAVGAPLTLTNTVTAGVISSTGRCASELGIDANINYIQTDAAITFGNSGGPLINLDGEAIGINSMKVAAGISFAIPINHAKKFLARTEAGKSSGLKKPSQSYMGVTILTITEEIKQELELRGYRQVSQGVLVWTIVVGSPAYLAGMKPGDIIVRINGTEITSSADFHEISNSSDKLNIHVQRGDKVYACTVTPEQIMED